MKQIYLLLIALIAPLLCAEDVDDPFAPPPTPEKEKTEIWVFTIRPDGPLREGLPDNYDPMDEYDETLTSRELAMLKYFHNEGVDFMGVSDATLCISESSFEALTKYTISQILTDRAFIIVKQNKENLLKIEELLNSFGDPVKAEPVATGQRR